MTPLAGAILALTAVPLVAAAPDEAKRRADIEAPSEICGVTVAKAADELARLRAAADVEIVELVDLINISQNGFQRWWTFTRPNHPAYPAFACSWPREREGRFEMGMDGRCGMDADACMAFFYEMKRRNAALTLEMRALRGERD